MNKHWSGIGRYTDHDTHFWRFKHSRLGRWRTSGVSLATGGDEDEPHNVLRVSGFGHALAIKLPEWVKPYRRWVDTSHYAWSKGEGSGYWDTHRRDFGFSASDGAIHFHYGPQTHDSTTTKSKVWFYPWREHQHIRHSLYDLEGEHFADLPEWGFRHKNGWAVKNAIEEACPVRRFEFADFDGERIVAASGPVGLNVIALGAGDGTLEVRLVQHLIEEAHAPSIELCLLDISQPLLSCAYKHAADTLTGIPNVHVWGMQCNFHHMPLYTQLYYTPARLQRRRVFCMLGGTLANLDNEPRFFQHSLLGCSRGDLLLLDMQVARGSVDDPAEIKKRDKTWSSGVSPAHAAWLSGPIWRHCKDVLSVEFHWNLDTQCPVPGSYALDAVATVQSRGRADRQFSLFRFRRYEPSKLAECLAGLGWDEIGLMPYGGADQPASLRLFCKRTDGS